MKRLNNDDFHNILESHIRLFEKIVIILDAVEKKNTNGELIALPSSNEILGNLGFIIHECYFDKWTDDDGEWFAETPDFIFKDYERLYPIHETLDGFIEDCYTEEKYSGSYIDNLRSILPLITAFFNDISAEYSQNGECVNG